MKIILSTIVGAFLCSPAHAQSLRLSIAVPAARPAAVPLGTLGILPAPRLLSSRPVMPLLPVPVISRLVPGSPSMTLVADLMRLPAERSTAVGQAEFARFMGLTVADVKASKGSSRSGSKKMPDPEDKRDNGEDLSDLDELGNPRRRGGNDGPDDVSDEFTGGGRGNSDLF